jgi:hypothetical protein
MDEQQAEHEQQADQEQEQQLEEQMQQQVLAECWRCHEPLLENEPQTELPCHHFLHTTCFVQIVHYNLWRNCPICNEVFNQNEEDEEETPAAQLSEETRIQNLYNSNARFKEAAKKLVKQKGLCSSSRMKVAKLVKEKKNEVRNQLLLIKAQLQGITETKKREVMNSQEYKNYIKSQRAYTMMENKLRADYNCSPKLLSRALYEKPGFRRFNPRSRWFHRSYYLFQRPWYFRVPV